MSDRPKNPVIMQVNLETGFVDIKVTGFWHAEELNIYLAETGRHLVALKKQRKPWDMLADISESPPQTNIVQQARQRVLQQCREAGMRRVAYIVANTLSQVQMERINQTVHNTARFFRTREEAEAWLREHSNDPP